MLRGVSYSNGRVKAIDIGKFKPNKSLNWINVSEPSLKELKTLSEISKIPLFELKHAIDSREKPRAGSRKNYSLVIFRAMSLDIIDRKSTYPVEFVVTKNLLITLTPEKSKVLDTVFMETDANVWKTVFNEGFSVIVYKVLLKLLRDYENYLEDAEEIIDSLEDASLDARDKDLQSLLRLKRKLIYLRRSLLANKDMLNDINTGSLEYVKVNDYFREVYTEYAQVASTEELIKDRVTGVMEMFLSSTSNNLNKIIKSFTVIASVLLLPMLISSIYGMNLILPLGTHRQGFLIIGAIMLLSVFFMLMFFSVKKWL